MEQEEREIYERDLARCRAESERLRALEGDPEARAALDEAWAPLLLPLPPVVVCNHPYYFDEQIA